MKSLIFFFFSFLIIIRISFSQDAINPYLDYDQQPSPDIDNQNYNYAPYQYGINITGTPYNGEYEINIRDLYAEYDGYPSFSHLAKSYQMEIVSFPFTMDCAFSSSGCADPPGTTTPSPRVLHMPSNNSPYNSSMNIWDYPGQTDLYNITPLKEFVNNLSSEHTPCYAHSLVSAQFVADFPIGSCRKALPHTVLIHTINIHCGNSKNDPIVQKFEFIYDNTRGRMKEYPFKNDNIATSSPANLYDQVFFPRLLLNDYWEYYSQSNHPGDIILPAGTIAYHPYDDIVNNYGGCTQANATLPPNNSFGSFIYPYSGSLLSAPLRQWRGDVLAGYQDAGGNILNKIDGLEHNYFIDIGYPNLDLNIINPSEKIIYNPSEVDVSAPVSQYPEGVVFPADYTFKTIRGVYPSESEVTAAANDAGNIAANGGAYADLRDVPVPTDLSPTSDPADASVYNIKQGSMITVEPCVKIFDATFNIESGAAMVFEDWPQTYGTHRFNINNSAQGGSLLIKNKQGTQYLQNGTVFQNYTITADAFNAIEAGSNVDPDITVTQGDFIINSGADVTFHAEQGIKLKSGFKATNGSTFKTNLSMVPSYSACINSNRVIGNIHTAPSNTSDYLNFSIKLFPNPTSEKAHLELTLDEDAWVSIEIIDTYGRLIANPTEDKPCFKGKNQFSFWVKNLKPGMYSCRIIANYKKNDLDPTTETKMLAIVR